MRWRIALAIFAPIAAVSGVAAVVTRAEPTTNGAATTGTAAERAPSAKQFTTEAFLKHYYETLDLTYRERKFLHHAREDCIELVHKRFSRVHAGVPALADELTSPQSTLGLLTASEQAAQQFVRDAMQRYLGLDGHLHALADEIDNTLRSRAEQEARERCRRLEEALQAAGVAENGLAAARNAFWENLAVTVPSVVTQAAESASAQRVAAAATAAVAAGAGTAATLVMTGVRFSWLTGAGSILLGTAAGIAYFLFNRDDCRATVEHEIIQAIEPLEQQFKDKACTRVHEVTQALFEHIRTAETQAVTATLAQASRQR